MNWRGFHKGAEIRFYLRLLCRVNKRVGEEEEDEKEEAATKESVRRVEEDYKASINTSKNRSWSHSSHQLYRDVNTCI